MTPTPPPLRARLRPLVLVGLIAGGIRYALEFLAPDLAMYFGVYYIEALAVIVIGVTGRWGRIRWTAMLGTMVLVALVVWGIWNFIAYTTGQFLEWDHGRFKSPDRALPIADTPTMKILLGLGTAAGTSIAGTMWLTLLGTLFVWLPAKLRGRDAPA